MIQFDFDSDGNFRARFGPKEPAKKPVEQREAAEDEPLPDITPESQSEHEER
jgi:hypothetical protein